jgi:phage N-6-adenine-methyltransferase
VEAINLSKYNILSLEPHPLADIYPDMTPDEFDGLVRDIAEHGLQQAIVTLDGKILDGRHRYRAVQQLREGGTVIELRCVTYDGADPVGFVHSVNFHRRHLSVTQKACIGVEYKRRFQEEIKPGRPSGDNSANICGINSPEREARNKAAQLVGVSHTTIDKAARVQEEAPAMFDAMKDGGISVWEAERELNSVAEGNEPSARLAPLMTSNSFEWYTPAAIIERVRSVLGAVELDPCTHPDANAVVQAQEFYTRDDDGLSKPWHGAVFMNPPYGDAISKWVEKLAVEFAAGRVTKAVALIPARTDTAWFRLLREYPRCFLYGRIQFGGPDAKGNSATFPSVVVALGCDASALRQAFKGLGDTYQLVS